MNITYRSNKLQKQLSNATEIKKAFGQMAKKMSSRLDDIISSPSLAVLMQIPAANCHPLTGDRIGEWAVNISGNHRLIFELDHDPVPKKSDEGIDTRQITDIIITGTEDYH
jgi:proteic killer suppression protein